MYKKNIEESNIKEQNVLIDRSNFLFFLFNWKLFDILFNESYKVVL